MSELGFPLGACWIKAEFRAFLSPKCQNRQVLGVLEDLRTYARNVTY